MGEFITSDDGEMQYSKEELESLKRRGIPFEETLHVPTKKPTVIYEEELSKENVVGPLCRWTKEEVRRIFLQSPLVMLPPTEAGYEYVSFWNTIYNKVVDVLREKNEDKCSVKIFDLIVWLQDECVQGFSKQNLEDNFQIKLLYDLLRKYDKGALLSWAELYQAENITKDDMERPFYRFRRTPIGGDICNN